MFELFKPDFEAILLSVRVISANQRTQGNKGRKGISLLAECQDVKTFSGLLLIIGDFRTFSTKFCERFSGISSDFSKIWEISSDF